MEASHPNPPPETQLFDYLAPALLRERGELAPLAGPPAVRGLSVIVTHLKPAQ